MRAPRGGRSIGRDRRGPGPRPRWWRGRRRPVRRPTACGRLREWAMTTSHREAGIPDLEAWGSVHLIGIGGAGMSGIAHLLLAKGIAVTGSDLKHSRGLEDLWDAGAEVFVGHRADHVQSPDAVIVSSAIPEDNPELR